MSAIESVGHIDALPDRVDLLVIGGGPAGATAAIAAARSGLRTLLVDRVAHPREKVCGCCLAPRGQRTLRAMDLAGVIEGARRIDGVRLACSGREVLVWRAGTVSLSRATLDGGLLRAAAGAGATLAWPFVATVEPDGLTHLRGPGGERVVRSRLRVVADGLHGASLHASHRFAWRVRPRGRIGLGAILPAGCVRIAD
ncbi:MAG: FAD-dependent oxidoreductase, partial [Planctomycetota bacterium]